MQQWKKKVNSSLRSGVFWGTTGTTAGGSGQFWDDFGLERFGNGMGVFVGKGWDTLLFMWGLRKPHTPRRWVSPPEPPNTEGGLRAVLRWAAWGYSYE